MEQLSPGEQSWGEGDSDEDNRGASSLIAPFIVAIAELLGHNVVLPEKTSTDHCSAGYRCFTYHYFELFTGRAGRPRGRGVRARGGGGRGRGGRGGGRGGVAAAAASGGGFWAPSSTQHQQQKRLASHSPLASLPPVAAAAGSTRSIGSAKVPLTTTLPHPSSHQPLQRTFSDQRLMHALVEIILLIIDRSGRRLFP
jgi:hypothetical protein